jgi:hypothetical protein
MKTEGPAGGRSWSSAVVENERCESGSVRSTITRTTFQLDHMMFKLANADINNLHNHDNDKVEMKEKSNHMTGMKMRI